MTEEHKTWLIGEGVVRVWKDPSLHQSRSSDRAQYIIQIQWMCPTRKNFDHRIKGIIFGENMEDAFLAKAVALNLKEGDLIAVKGRYQRTSYMKNHKTVWNYEFVINYIDRAPDEPDELDTGYDDADGETYD